MLFSLAHKHKHISISTRKTTCSFFFMLMQLMLMRLFLCLCASENSLRQISGFVVMFVLKPYAYAYVAGVLSQCFAYVML